MPETTTPNPGSDEAIALGCECPILDNGHGKGSPEYGGQFIVTEGCPLHDKPLTSDRRENGIGVWYMGGCDNVAARTEKEAVSWYKTETGLTDKDLEEYGGIEEVEDLDAQHLRVLDEDERPTGEVISFREAIRREVKFPCIIATEE